MGYDLHITRVQDWFGGKGPPITPEEWLAVVASDPELTIEYPDNPYFATWSGECSYPHGAWFNLFQGNVYTKNPDRAILAKLLQLAERLNARVIGDDGEIYTSVDEPPVQPSPP